MPAVSDARQLFPASAKAIFFITSSADGSRSSRFFVIPRTSQMNRWGVEISDHQTRIH
jgi:hypothetical protein